MNHNDMRAALERDYPLSILKAFVAAYVAEQEAREEPQQPQDATFTEQQVMELVVAVRDAMLGVLPPTPNELSTLALFRWLRDYAGSSMTNVPRAARRYRDDAKRFRAEAFVEGMRWRYGMRMDRAAKAISTWREKHMGAVKPEPPATLTPEQQILLAQLTRETRDTQFGVEDVFEQGMDETVQRMAEAADEEANRP